MINPNAKYPEMIIFDYGHTLLYEPDWDSHRGNNELFKYITKNPNNITVEDYEEAVKRVFGKSLKIRENENCDILASTCHRVIDELLGIEFSLSDPEREMVFWKAASNGAAMSGAGEMLDYLNENGIRTAVISNLSWSGKALEERFSRLLPNNKFEFVMTSSDYLFRKSDSILFEIALKKAGISAEKVWYCGDSIRADIYGAHDAGIFPVLYESEIPAETNNNGLTVDFDYLHIHHWKELIEIIEELK